MGLADATKARSAMPRTFDTYAAYVRSQAKCNKLHAGSKSEDGDSKLSQRVKDLAHLKDLKSQNYTAEFELAAYVSPRAVERSGLSARNRLNGSLRDHSNAVALVGKSAPTKQSNLQISRIPIGSVGTSEIAYQFTTLMVLDLASEFASVLLPTAIRDPLASGAFTGRCARALSGLRDETTFVMAHHANELLEGAPRFLKPSSFLGRARALARAELDTSEISRVVTQTTDHLRYTCSRIASSDEASDGSRTWFAFSLIIYLATDMRLHVVLERWGFTEYDLAIAHAMLNYARQLVGNRSRECMSKLEQGATERAKRKLDSPAEQLWKVSSDRFVDDGGLDGSDEEDSGEVGEVGEVGEAIGDDDASSVAQSDVSETSGPSTALLSSPPFAKQDVVNLADVAVATRIVCTQELARKSRRIDAESPATHSCVHLGVGFESATPKSAMRGRGDGASSSAVSGAPKVKAILEFLHLHFLQDNGFLTHLYSDTAESALNASMRVLEWQLKSKNINPDLRNPFTETLFHAAQACAHQTRSNLLQLVEQSVYESPSIVSWSDASGASQAVYTGVLRNPRLDADGHSVGSARLFVCSAPVVAQPVQSAKSTVVWSAASATSLATDGACVSVDGVVEAFRLKARLGASSSHIDSSVRCKALEDKIRRTSTELMGPGETGITRSTLVYDAYVPVNSEVLRAALAVGMDIVGEHAKVCGDGPPRTNRANKATYSCAATSDVGVPRPIAVDTPHPSVTPSNVFTIGMYLLECTRTAYNQIAPKQSILAVPIAPESIPKSLESIEAKAVNPKTRPWCFLNVDDIKFQARHPRRLLDRVRSMEGDGADGADDAPPAHVQRVATHASVSVCGDRALDVPTALRLITQVAWDARKTSTAGDVTSRLSLLRQWRSVCYAGGIQCCTFHQFSNSVASREMNTKIEGTNKIEAPDNHYLAFPTIYQAYVVGHTNLPVMFEGTPWCDTYGSGYECGAIASVGINGRSCVSDFRNAAFSLMDQTQVDRLCAKLGLRGAVPCADGKSHLRVPMGYLGGLPRIMLPGVHAALNGLSAAFDLLDRVASSEPCCDTRASIQVLPFSPFTQAVSPVVSAAANGMDFRDNARKARGKGVADPCPATEHPRPLRTLRQDSILNSDLMQSVCVKLVSTRTDNMYETIEPAIASVLVFASQIVELATKVATDVTGTPELLNCTDCLAHLRRETIAFVHAEEAEDGGCFDECTAVLVVDALVLFNCIFPLRFDVGEPCLLKALERAPNAVLRGQHTRRLSALVLEETSDADRADLKHFADRVFDDAPNGPWAIICRFLCMVSTHGRTFDNTAPELRTCARCVEMLGQAAWLVHSDDGTSPPQKWSPLHCRASPDKVEGPDLCCVWVDRPNCCQPNRRTQRGAVLGLPNAGPQQVLMLLTGAFIDDVRVQYVRNEGNMCTRMSACALKENDGVKLSAKSTCPIYSDNDDETFGTLEAKEAQAKRQVAAWRANNELIFEVSTRFCEPRTEGKFAGANFTYHNIAETLASWQASGRVSSQQCAGERLMAEAVASMDARKVSDL